MCTVTYIPQKNTGGFILTSNRDEKSCRPTIPPQIYQVNGMNICFPKDEQAGGSWIASNDRGRLCCLLNGAFLAHQKKPRYVQSRGTVLLELVSSVLTPADFFQVKNLRDVEPFTMITLEIRSGSISHLSEFIWDGHSKHLRNLPQNEPGIWSSVTLYDEEHRKLRRQWFKRLLANQNGTISPKQIFDFHSGSHTNNPEIDVVMERDGGMKTVSITQVVPEQGKFRMAYYDLQQQFNKEVTT